MITINFCPSSRLWKWIKKGNHANYHETLSFDDNDNLSDDLKLKTITVFDVYETVRADYKKVDIIIVPSTEEGMHNQIEKIDSMYRYINGDDQLEVFLKLINIISFRYQSYLTTTISGHDHYFVDVSGLDMKELADYEKFRNKRHELGNFECAVTASYINIGNVFNNKESFDSGWFYAEATDFEYFSDNGNFNMRYPLIDISDLAPYNNDVLTLIKRAVIDHNEFSFLINANMNADLLYLLKNAVSQPEDCIFVNIPNIRNYASQLPEIKNTLLRYRCAEELRLISNKYRKLEHFEEIDDIVEISKSEINLTDIFKMKSVLIKHITDDTLEDRLKRLNILYPQYLFPAPLTFVYSRYTKWVFDYATEGITLNIRNPHKKYARDLMPFSENLMKNLTVALEARFREKYPGLDISVIGKHLTDKKNFVTYARALAKYIDTHD